MTPRRRIGLAVLLIVSALLTLLAMRAEAAPSTVTGRPTVRIVEGQRARDVAADRIIAHLPADGAAWPAARAAVEALGYATRTIAGCSGLVISLPPGRDPLAAAAEVRAAVPALRAVGPVGIARAYASTPNDPAFASQYHHGNIRSTNGWDEVRATGSIDGDLDEIVIAIVDSGQDPDHEDLRASSVGGFDFVDDDNDPSDCDGHGTHVAGIAAAITANAVGVAGVAGGWSADGVAGARLMAVRVLDCDGSGSFDDIAEGITFAAQNGARVVNLSLGGPTGEADAAVLQSAVDFARAKGAVVVGAAGNDGVEIPASDFPGGASFGGIVVVSATDTADKPADFTNFGSTIDVAAPGVAILSTWGAGIDTAGTGGCTTSATDSYCIESGTSMASPVVAGVAAMILAKNGFLGPDDVEAIIRNSARAVGNEERTGEGVVDLDAALALTPDSGPFGDVVLGRLEAIAYPNPFRPDAGTLRFSASDFREKIRSIRIMTLDGRVVRTLGASGFMVLDWDGRNDAGAPLASGVYLYEMETTSGRTALGRFTLVR